MDFTTILKCGENTKFNAGITPNFNEEITNLECGDNFHSSM